MDIQCDTQCFHWLWGATAAGKPQQSITFLCIQCKWLTTKHTEWKGMIITSRWVFIECKLIVINFDCLWLWLSNVAATACAIAADAICNKFTYSVLTKVATCKSQTTRPQTHFGINTTVNVNCMCCHCKRDMCGYCKHNTCRIGTFFFQTVTNLVNVWRFLIRAQKFEGK